MYQLLRAIYLDNLNFIKGRFVSAIASLLRCLKNACVSDETRYRKALFGICKGCYLPLNLKHHFRLCIGLYEMPLIRFVKSYIRSGTCCYDIGAGLGYYTFSFARLSQSGRVYAIEADQDLCEAMRGAVFLNNHIKSKIEILNSFIGSFADQERKRTTIDHMVFSVGYPPPHLIKIDVEGAEYEALLGAQMVIKYYSPKFIIEVHSAELEQYCKSFLEERKYRIVIVNQNLLFPEKRPLPHNRWICAECLQNLS